MGRVAPQSSNPLSLSMEHTAMAKSNTGRIIPTPTSLMGALQDEANRQARIRPNCPPIYTPARVLSVLGLFPAILAAVEAGIDSIIAIHAARVLAVIDGMAVKGFCDYRSEEHTSELQSLRHLVC